MCVAAPMRVIATAGDTITVEIGGVREKASALLLPDVRVGDFVLVHAGFAIQRLDEEAARETLRLFAEIAALDGDSGDGQPGDGQPGDGEPRDGEAGSAGGPGAAHGNA